MDPRHKREQCRKDAETLSRYEHKVTVPLYQADNPSGLETSLETDPRRPRQTKDER